MNGNRGVTFFKHTEPARENLEKISHIGSGHNLGTHDLEKRGEGGGERTKGGNGSIGRGGHQKDGRGLRLTNFLKVLTMGGRGRGPKGRKKSKRATGRE